MSTITRESLVEMLMDQRGSVFLSVTARTDPRLKKKGNNLGNIVKVSKVNVCANFHYDAGVVRRLEKEGKSIEDFQRGEAWHEPVKTSDGKLTPLCKHKTTGELYLRVQKLGVGQTVYLNDQGKVVPENEIAPFLPAENHYSNQGRLDNPLEFVIYKIDGLAEVSMNGETYTITHDV